MIGMGGYPAMMFGAGMPSDWWKSQPKPKFSGKPHDYAKFELDWGDLEYRYRETFKGCWNEHFMLTDFRNCLDEATQLKLKARQRERSGLTLTEFKRELREEFGIDAQRQYRRDWESVVLSLSGPKDHELTMSDWRKFEAQYKLCRSQVPERSATEEWRMLFAKLPARWQEAVVKEQAKRRERKPWVRVSVPGLATADVLAIVQEFTGKRLPEYEAGTGGVVFKVSKDKERSRLLHLQNAETECGRKVVERWIKEGAEYQGHWAFQVPAKPAVPAIPAGGNAIDAFLAAPLAAKGLTPNGPAPKTTLLRRAALDLTGLPPSDADLQAFLAGRTADRPQAIAECVWALLSSTEFRFNH